VRADPDPRIRAVLAISPAEPRDPAHWSSRRILQRVTAPGLHLTGTEDRSKLGFTAPEARRTAYDAIGAGQQHLLVLDGVRHETFAAEPDAVPEPLRPALAASRPVTLAFWDAFLRGDAAAADWLTDGGCATAVAGLGSWEWRRPTSHQLLQQLDQFDRDAPPLPSERGEHRGQG
jgi:hypothetical protein